MLKRRIKRSEKKTAYLFSAVEPELARWVRRAAKKELRSVSNFIRQRMVELREASNLAWPKPSKRELRALGKAVRQ